MSRTDTVKKDTVRGIVVILVILLVLCATLFVRYNHLKKQYQANSETIEVLEGRMAQEELRTGQLEQQEAYQQTDAYVEETARKLLNLVMPGDTTIKPNEQE